MKSFKGYLKEAPAWTESLSDMLFDLPRAGLYSREYGRNQFVQECFT